MSPLRAEHIRLLGKKRQIAGRRIVFSLGNNADAFNTLIGFAGCTTIRRWDCILDCPSYPDPSFVGGFQVNIDVGLAVSNAWNAKKPVVYVFSKSKSVSAPYLAVEAKKIGGKSGKELAKMLSVGDLKDQQDMCGLHIKRRAFALGRRVCCRTMMKVSMSMSRRS